MKTIAAALLITCFSLSSFASEPGEKRMKHLTKRLDLTNEQVVQVETIFDSKKQQREAIHSQMKALHMETNKEIAEILNDEQREEFSEMQEKMKDKRKKFH